MPATPPANPAPPPRLGWRSRWALGLYLLLAGAMTPLWRWALRQRLARGKETPHSLAQKCMHQPAPRPAGPLVWGHAVGVGEAMALAGLFAQLAPLWPQAHFLLTTTARTSGDALHRSGLPARCTHQFAPIDTPRTVAAFLDHWQPALALWCEMDIWPALAHATAQRGIAHALVNARLDARTLARRRKGRWLYQALLPSFATLWAQNEATREGLMALGAQPQRVRVTGTIKAFSPPLACDTAALAAWQHALAQRPVWLLASSHPGEEALALAAHALLRQQHPNALLLLAPRAPARGPEVAALCAPSGLLRSASALPSAPHSAPHSTSHSPTLSAPHSAHTLAQALAHTSVYVADTIGEMGLWYRLARVAMLGGSWASVGGHNPHEPHALGCAVLHGPHVWNFAESYAALDAQGASRLCTDAEDIAQQVGQAWASATAQKAARINPPAAWEPLRELLQLAGGPKN